MFIILCLSQDSSSISKRYQERRENWPSSAQWPVVSASNPSPHALAFIMGSAKSLNTTSVFTLQYRLDHRVVTDKVVQELSEQP